jgi:phosphoribosylamine--glycine ligase
VKADGLAAGKGVVVANTLADAALALHDMLGGGALGQAGHRVVVEEFLAGEEASYIVMSDGRNVLPFATSQDHKRRDDADLGPNTGGMGAYSPAPVVTREVEYRVLREVIEPTIRGMAAEGAPFIGFLYAGLMIAPDGTLKVLEFNVRFGDPETQPIMMRLRSDLVDLVEAALDGRLDQVEAQWDPRPALGVVMAARGYPGTPRTGGRDRGAGPTNAAGCQGVPCRDAARGRPRGHGGRTRADGLRARPGRRRRTAPRLRNGAWNFVGRRVPPPRHRLARDLALVGRYRSPVRPQAEPPAAPRAIVAA